MIARLMLLALFASSLYASDVVNEKKDVLNGVSIGGLIESDFDFKKDVYPDQNLSPLVKTLLSHPLRTFDFVQRLEQELKETPWDSRNQQSGGKSSVPAEINHEIRIGLENLLSRLSEREKRLARLLGKSRLEERGRALECFAVETFHLEQDPAALKRWGMKTGSPDSLKILVEKVRDLKADDWDMAAAQLKVGHAINPVLIRKELSELLGDIENFVEEGKERIRRNPNDFSFAKLSFDTPIGRVVLGGVGPQSYKVDEGDILIDFGGDDSFDHASCANGLLEKPFSLVIDFRGNDRYQEGASGIWGVGIIWDEEGNDQYEGTDVSFGAGVFGAGVLVDRSGNDHYRSDTLAQGSASFGYGLLWDGVGEDRYDVALYGQGFAGVNGLGVLSDIEGNDEYKAGGKYPDFDRLPNHYLSLSQGFSMGSRPFAPGGVGILHDLKGNDEYIADIFGQGSSYWYACGVLIDGSGNDRYKAYQYDQGTGIHLSVGILKDGGGNDSYLSESGLAQAGPHDFGVGLLWDAGGNDSYVAESASQGCAINNSVGILYDEGGDDQYKITEPKHGNGQGRGEYAATRGFGSVGVLLNIGGSDQYSHQQHDNHVVVRESIGVSVDVSDRAILNEWKKSWAESLEAEKRSSFLKLSTKAKSNVSPSEDLSPNSGDESYRKVENLLKEGMFAFGWFVKGEPAGGYRSIEDIQKEGGNLEFRLLLAQASRSGDMAWKVEERTKATKKLETLSLEDLEAAYPWIAQGIMNRIKMEDLIVKKGDEGWKLLRKFSQHDWPELRSLAVYMMRNDAKPEDAVYALKSLGDEKTRTSALVMLSKSGVGHYQRDVRRFLGSPKAIDRTLSVKILSETLSDRELFKYLEDPDWNVRTEAAKAIKRRGKLDQDLEKNLSLLGHFWLKKIEVEKVTNP